MIAASLCAVFVCLAGVAAEKQVEAVVASATQQIMTCRFIIECRPSPETSSNFLNVGIRAIALKSAVVAALRVVAPMKARMRQARATMAPKSAKIPAA